MQRFDAPNVAAFFYKMNGRVVCQSRHAQSEEVGEQVLVGERTRDRAARVGEECLPVNRFRQAGDGARGFFGRGLHALDHIVERGAEPADLIAPMGCHAM